MTEFGEVSADEARVLADLAECQDQRDKAGTLAARRLDLIRSLTAENERLKAEIRAEHKWKAQQAGAPCQCEICVGEQSPEGRSG